MNELEDLRSLFHQTQEFAKASKTPTYLLVPNQKKLQSYSGPPSDVKLEDWIYDMSTALKARTLSKKAEVDFALQYLTGAAREEVKYHKVTSLDTLFKVLRDTFGDHGSSVSMQRTFFERKQAQDETLTTFSHSLLDLFNKAARKCPQLMEKREHLLKDQFAEGVHDVLLRKYLKSKLREFPDIDFFALRTEAIEWAEETEGTTSSSPVTSVAISRQSAKEEPSIKSLLDIMVKQQEQIDHQQKQLDELTVLVQQLSQAKPTPKSKRQTNMTCTFCNKTGHTTERCFQRRLKEAHDTIEELRKSVKTPSQEN